ncbi:hypothetical protein M440DRAFT_1465209 [Trichoderma longibrachiatum ATCC 18648]|uniref:Secreted protein n=1 Tax=Trichoderma longibrachiatum ATCC 18648 TaxID=983965 RepID=A0A2T4BVB2_TRILO|nr:hypothetical protein M440DRAFT_1465209 [Trichoderma longibrachiatum ATCC 18648]
MMCQPGCCYLLSLSLSLSLPLVSPHDPDYKGKKDDLIRTNKAEVKPASGLRRAAPGSEMTGQAGRRRTHNITCRNGRHPLSQPLPESLSTWTSAVAEGGCPAS